MVPITRSMDRLVQIGNICNQWSYLEYLFSNVIWWLLKIDRETGMIVTGGMDILPRANMAINLAKHLKADSKLINALSEARKSIQNDLGDKRNTAVHGVYFRTPNDETKVEMHRGKGAFEKQDFSNEQLRDVGRNIQAVHKKLVPVLLSLGIKWE